LGDIKQGHVKMMENGLRFLMLLSQMAIFLAGSCLAGGDCPVAVVLIPFTPAEK